MAITTTTISINAGWARTDVIVQLENAFRWLGWHGDTQTGIVTGISAYSGGGTVVGQGYDYFVYEDVPVSTTSGFGTGATFSVRRYNGSINAIQVNRPGVGYTNGEYVTLAPSDIGGSGATAIGITVSVLGGASPTGVGSTTTFYRKDLTPNSTYPWGVMRHVIQPNKKYGTTFRGFVINGNNLYQSTGSGFHPHTITNTSDMGNGYATRYAGTRGLDLYSSAYYSTLLPSAGDARFDSSNASPSASAVGTYASSSSYQLDLNIFRSGIDPNFAVLSFRHPTLSSTHLAGNTYLTFIIHNFTTSIWDLDNLFLGGTTFIAPDNPNSNNPHLVFTTYLEGQYYARRTAEWGYSRAFTYKTTRYYSNIHPTNDATSISSTGIYYRENTSLTDRGTGGPSNNYVYLPSSTNYNAVIKGIPLNSNMVPCPYYIPDDFVLIDFDYGVPSANIQQGDTITVSGSEVYTVITGSYNQNTRTRGILFCARKV